MTEATWVDTPSRFLNTRSSEENRMSSSKNNQVELICKRCAKRFSVRASHAHRYINCSRACASNTTANFWEQVDKTSECWVWTGNKCRDGYGKIKVRSKTVRAHRFSWELHFGPVPNGKFVLHNCPSGDNPSCVNPGHLWLGTNQDNVDDMFAKNRQNKAKGEKHGLQKYSTEVIQEALRRRKAGEKICRIAESLGISASHMSGICRGRYWSHLVTLPNPKCGAEMETN